MGGMPLFDFRRMPPPGPPDPSPGSGSPAVLPVHPAAAPLALACVVCRGHNICGLLFVSKPCVFVVAPPPLLQAQCVFQACPAALGPLGTVSFPDPLSYTLVQSPLKCGLWKAPP